MRMNHLRRQSGLALVSAIIVMVCILIIGGIVVKLLLRLSERINPPAPPEGGTNVTATAASGFAGITAPGVWKAPQLQFPALPTPAGQTSAKPFGTARMEIERSTNLVDWETIAVVADPSGDVDIMSLDTNRPPARAFYRGKFVYP